MTYISTTTLLALLLGLQITAQAQIADIHSGCPGVDSILFAQMEHKIMKGHEWTHPFCIQGTEAKKYTIVLSKGMNYQCISSNHNRLFIQIFDIKTHQILITNRVKGHLSSSILFECKQTGVYTFQLSFEKPSENDVGGVILAFEMK